jgi:hypothetical protein
MSNQPLLYIDEFGNKSWFLNGEYHREDEPAFKCVSGYEEWYLNGKLHRENGPAITYSGGSKQWYLNGELHRVDGPAIVWSDVEDYEYYLNGRRYSSKDEWFRKLTPEQQYSYLWNLDE